jgi:hypothetical protein
MGLAIWSLIQFNIRLDIQAVRATTHICEVVDVQSTADFAGDLLVLLTLVDKHKKDCSYDDEGDDKNQSGSEDALATIGTPGRRMAHPITTIRAELLRWVVSHFSPWLVQNPLPLNLRIGFT